MRCCCCFARLRYLFRFYVCPCVCVCVLCAVYERLKREGAVREWNPDREEELEDNEGNVFNKKMYDDLRRQGLI